MKKWTVFGLTVMLLVSVVSVAMGVSLMGEVTANELMGNVIEIRTWEDLHNMRDDLAGSYRLMNDLGPEDPGYHDYASDQANGGEGWLRVGYDGGSFRGTFDGQNHTITGLYIDRTTRNLGMFGYVGSSGEVRNIGLVDVDMSWTGWGSGTVGGLVGRNEGTVSNSYATGQISDSSMSGAGGLVGRNYGTVNNSYASVNLSGHRYVGGLVGDNYGTVDNSYATGTVSGDRYVGGLVGYNRGSVSNSYATGTVNGDEEVGGLVGTNSQGTVSNAYAIGYVSGDRNVGGLVGLNRGSTVYNTYATGDVTGNVNVGGLVGQSHRSISGDTVSVGTVSNSYATGNVSGNRLLGGLVGQNHRSKVSNSYATGTATRLSGDSEYVGGFTGRNYQGKIIHCYSTASLHYEGVADPTDKGFAGVVETGGEYEVTGNFWDVEISGQTSTAGNATGRTTAEMMDISKFSDAGWDIVTVATPNNRDNDYIWNIVDGETYPFLSSILPDDGLPDDNGDDDSPAPGILMFMISMVFALAFYMKKGLNDKDPMEEKATQRDDRRFD